MTPNDRIQIRTVKNLVKLIQEHLEAMQRDTQGLENPRWKQEVDEIWKQVFLHINRMSTKPQQSSLDSIKELWTTYLTHYVTTT